MSPMSATFVSIIVPVYNDPEGLRATLAALSAQRWPSDRCQVIVVDNASSDRTPAVAREFQSRLSLRCAHETRRSSYAARNRGILLATGQVLAFVDAGITMAPDWLATAISAMERHQADYLGCPVVIQPPARPGVWARYDSRHGFPVADYMARHGFAGAGNILVRRRVIDAVGPFDPGLQSSGDLDFGNRVQDAGFRMHYCGQCPMWHPARTSARALIAKADRIGAGHCDLKWRHPRRYGVPDFVDPLRILFQRPRSPGHDAGLPAAERLRMHAVALLMRATSARAYFRRYRQLNGLLRSSATRTDASREEMAEDRPAPPPKGNLARHRPTPWAFLLAAPPGWPTALKILLSDFRRRPPVLVYQMGKVGSAAVAQALAEALRPSPIYHVHFLSADGIRDVDTFLRRTGLNRRGGHLTISRALRRRLRWRPSRPWRIVTLVRDPIARDLSDVFQNAALICSEVLDRRGGIDPAAASNWLQARWAAFDPDTDPTATWFDRELIPVFGIDVYATPFDHAAGFSILRQPEAEVLILRQEDLSRAFAPAMRAFFKLAAVPALPRCNVTSRSAGAGPHRRLQETLRLPAGTCERIYATRYARHFFTRQERRRLIHRWSNGR